MEVSMRTNCTGIVLIVGDKRRRVTVKKDPSKKDSLLHLPIWQTNCEK